MIARKGERPQDKFFEQTINEVSMQMFTLHPSICKLNYYVSPQDNLPPEAESLKTKLLHCAKLRKSKVPWTEVTEQGKSYATSPN